MGRVVLLALRRRASWTLRFWLAALESRGPTHTFKLCGENSGPQLSLPPQLARLSVVHCADIDYQKQEHFPGCCVGLLTRQGMA